VALLGALVVLLAGGGCSQGYGQTGSGHTLCHAKDDITLTAGVIVGTVTASCEVPPTAHHLALFLRYQPGGSKPPPKGTMASKTSDRIPVPGGDVTLELRHTCLPGTWWVEFLVAGTSPDGTPFGTSRSDKYGTVSLDDCNRR
jgi:hypothetical protein